MIITEQYRTSICGSQIYTPGTATCYNGLLCVYKPNSAGVANIVTFPCGSQCYDAANYVCMNGQLVVATGTASVASVTRAAASTQLAGATGSATPIVSSAIISRQSVAASSAARSVAATSSAASTAQSSSDATIVQGHTVALTLATFMGYVVLGLVL